MNFFYLIFICICSLHNVLRFVNLIILGELNLIYILLSILKLNRCLLPQSSGKEIKSHNNRFKTSVKKKTLDPEFSEVIIYFV